MLENACKWGRRQVQLVVRVTEGICHIGVEDDGPGCPKPALSEILSRGARLDERTDGHGLGLSIVREIVILYRRELRIGRAALGGLGVAVRLPLPGVFAANRSAR